MGKYLAFLLVFLVGCETTGSKTTPASTAADKPAAAPATSAASATPAKRDKLEGVPLVWKPTTNVASLGAVNLTGMSNVKIQVDPLDDKRSDRAFIGQNSERQPPRKVTTPDDVAAFVTDHMRSLMKGAGLNVVDSGGTAIVKGEIVQFFVEETDNYKGDVRIKVTVTDAAGKVVWNGMTGGSASRFGRSYKADNYYETLSDSLIEATYNLLKIESFHEALVGKNDSGRILRRTRLVELGYRLETQP